jgi:hypothetical protein
MLLTVPSSWTPWPPYALADTTTRRDAADGLSGARARQRAMASKRVRERERERELELRSAFTSASQPLLVRRPRSIACVRGCKRGGADARRVLTQKTQVLGTAGSYGGTLDVRPAFSAHHAHVLTRGVCAGG